jgi:hypothetical protein
MTLGDSEIYVKDMDEKIQFVFGNEEVEVLLQVDFVAGFGWIYLPYLFKDDLYTVLLFTCQEKDGEIFMNFKNYNSYVAEWAKFDEDEQNESVLDGVTVNHVTAKRFFKRMLSRIAEVSAEYQESIGTLFQIFCITGTSTVNPSMIPYFGKQLTARQILAFTNARVPATMVDETVTLPIEWVEEIGGELG